MTNSSSFANNQYVQVRELGLREGLQMIPTIVATEKKLELVEALLATGVSEIEVTSFVRPDRVPQMADAAALAALLPTREQRGEGDSSVRLTSLYLNQKGFVLAQETGAFDNQGWLYTAASEEFMKENSGVSYEQILSRVPGWCSLFQSHEVGLHGVMVSTAFGNGTEGKTDAARALHALDALLEAAAKAGMVPEEISLADTTGWGTPKSVSELVKAVQQEYPKIQVSLHLHDTRGIAMANVCAALEQGVRIFDASLGGVGGCPFAPGAAGNICTEDLVYLLHEEGLETGIDLGAYVRAAKLLADTLQCSLPGRLYTSGAFG